jgi:hypothetical protein
MRTGPALLFIGLNSSASVHFNTEGTEDHRVDRESHLLLCALRVFLRALCVEMDLPNYQVRE